MNKISTKILVETQIAKKILVETQIATEILVENTKLQKNPGADRYLDFYCRDHHHKNESNYF